MNNVVRGVTNDLVIKDMQSESDNADIDIREIEPVRNDVDVYMDDIYDPLIIPKSIIQMKMMIMHSLRMMTVHMIHLIYGNT